MSDHVARRRNSLGLRSRVFVQSLNHWSTTLWRRDEYKEYLEKIKRLDV